MSYYFAWVNPNQTLFDPHTMLVMNENIFAFKYKHEEGQIPTLDLTIFNPRVGLLAPGRKTWAWFAKDGPSGITPIFFGVLTGIPDNLFGELITLKFIARTDSYIIDKQAVAETMRVRPFYDPIFLSPDKRDDPDSILEGWSKLWHVDPVTLVTSASDILIGEDGTKVFTTSEAFYDGVSMKMGEAPLTNIEVLATVKWSQKSTGFVEGPHVNVQTYTGDTFLSQWPKPGSSLGGGWRVESSFVKDTFETALTPMISSRAHITNQDPTALDCSFETVDVSTSGPCLLGPSISGIILTTGQSGICDPTSDPPLNRPAILDETGITVPLWNLNCVMSLRYDAKRECQETLLFNVAANLQSVLASPTIKQYSEKMEVPTVDVGAPVIEVLAWTDFINSPVSPPTIIFPNDPSKPGGLNYQICIVAGTCGSTEPNFSDIPGALTDDGTAVWASLGALPASKPPGWSPCTEIGIGEIIYCTPEYFNNNAGTWEPERNGVYLLCYTGGITNSEPSETLWRPPPTSSDEAIAVPIPVFHINGPLDVFGAVSILPPTPTFTAAQFIGDGSVVWMMLDNPPFFILPVGGTPDEQGAYMYFPTDRGLWSLEYLIMKARARLCLRARAVTIGWDCPINEALGLTCRMNATLIDPRLPGGIATGKIISVEMSAEDGKEIGHIEIGVCVGFDGMVTSIPGTPEYTNGTGYCLPGYQRYDGQTLIIATGESDISYQPLQAPPAPGLPSWSGALSGSAGEQAGPIQASFAVDKTIAWEGYILSLAEQGSGLFGPIGSLAWGLVNNTLSMASGMTPYVMETNPVVYGLTAESVEEAPLANSYEPQVSMLELPKGIDLEASS